VGNLLIDLLSQNRDTVEVTATEEDRLTPTYQQLLGLEMREGWIPQLWRFATLPTGRTNLHQKLGELINVAEIVPKFKTVVRDHRTTQGMMEMTRLGKYYRVWRGFNINHLDGHTIGSTSSVSPTHSN
jgi:hypothetical protein